MTNAEKYLKDGVSAEEFVKAVWGSCYNIPEAEGDKNYKNCMMYGATIERWLKKQVTPTLTEDERVILRNIKDKPRYIAREKHYRLMAYDKVEKDDTSRSYDNGKEMSSFSHLFQFIKERRRIRNKRIVRR